MTVHPQFGQPPPFFCWEYFMSLWVWPAKFTSQCFCTWKPCLKIRWRNPFSNSASCCDLASFPRSLRCSGEVWRLVGLKSDFLVTSFPKLQHCWNISQCTPCCFSHLFCLTQMKLWMRALVLHQRVLACSTKVHQESIASVVRNKSYSESSNRPLNPPKNGTNQNNQIKFHNTKLRPTGQISTRYFCPNSRHRSEVVTDPLYFSACAWVLRIPSRSQYIGRMERELLPLLKKRPAAPRQKMRQFTRSYTKLRWYWWVTAHCLDMINYH